MHAIPVALPETPATHTPQQLAARTPLSAVKAIQDPSAVARAEVNRWILFLSFPFVLAAIFFMATISTGQKWLIGGALVTGPGLLIMAFIYLGLSSDTNGTQ